MPFSDPVLSPKNNKKTFYKDFNAKGVLGRGILKTPSDREAFMVHGTLNMSESSSWASRGTDTRRLVLASSY